MSWLQQNSNWGVEKCYQSNCNHCIDCKDCQDWVEVVENYHFRGYHHQYRIIKCAQDAAAAMKEYKRELQRQNEQNWHLGRAISTPTCGCILATQSQKWRRCHFGLAGDSRNYPVIEDRPTGSRTSKKVPKFSANRVPPINRMAYQSKCKDCKDCKDCHDWVEVVKNYYFRGYHRQYRIIKGAQDAAAVMTKYKRELQRQNE